jgi:(2Fe-2S) ferredoxin
MSSLPGARPPSYPAPAAKRRRLLVLVCRGPECGDKRDSASVHRALTHELSSGRLPRGIDVSLKWQSCFGQCQKGVNVMVRELRENEDAFFLSFVPGCGDGGALYHAVRPSDAARIVDEHVIGGRPIDEFKRRG